MHKRIRMLIIALILAFVVVSANASGLFPDMDEMFGISMPSIGLAIGRPADEQEETENGSQEIYHNFSNDEYLVFGQYLAGTGAKLNEYKVKDNTMTASISARDSSMIFTYNWTQKIAAVNYPSDTRAETEKEIVNPKDSILPPVGGVMPSAEFAIDRKPDEQTANEEGITQTWIDFSKNDYSAFSTYLAKTGAELKESNIEAGILKAEIVLNECSFRFVFNWNTQTTSVIYPEGTIPESSRWNTLVGTGSLLPDYKTLGRELPRISAALKREPASTDTLQDGSIQETYLNFSEEDYKTFSQYLQKAECALEDYHTDEDGVLVINLSNMSGKMTFSYDAVRQIGTVTYPEQSRIEKGWSTTPTPEPQTGPRITPEPIKHYHSEDECWYTASTYFENLRWKNPKSLKVYGHTSSFSDGQYTFTIDYSAENGFGGTNRGYYWITVDAATNKVTFAFGDI